MNTLQLKIETIKKTNKYQFKKVKTIFLID